MKAAITAAERGHKVMIGAGRIGTECAIGMCKDGHKVTQISNGADLTL